MLMTAFVAAMLVSPAALPPDGISWLSALPLLMLSVLAGCQMWRWVDIVFPTSRMSITRGRLLGIRASWASVWPRAPP